MGAAGSQWSGLLLSFVARLGRQQFSLPWDRNVPLPAVDQPLSNCGHITPVLQLLAGLGAVVSKGKAGEAEKACVSPSDA